MTTPLYNWSKAEVQIIKAAWATDHGRRALTIIIEHLGSLHGPSFATDPMQMAFNEGRRFVARELMSAVNLPINKLVKEPDEPRDSRPPTATERAAAVADGTPIGGHLAAASARLGHRTTKR